MFYVYILPSLEDRGLYIGFSTNLKKRIAEHEHGSSFATKYRGPWKLMAITKPKLIDMMPKDGNVTSKAPAGVGSCVNN